MSIWRMPNSPSASTSAFITDGNAPAHPASPHPWAERVGGGRYRVEFVHEERRVAGARHRVIHVGAGQQLPVLVVDGALAQCLTDAWTMPPCACRHQERVDDDAKSLTKLYFTTSTMPVSGSTSTSAIWSVGEGEGGPS